MGIKKPIFHRIRQIPNNVVAWMQRHEKTASWLSAAFTGLIFLVTAIYASVAYFQMRAMHTTIQQTQTLIKQQREALGYANTQANAAKSQAETAASQSQAVIDSARAAKDSAEAAKTVTEQNKELIAIARIQANASQMSARAARDSVRVAEGSVEATQENTRLDQRAWIGVKTARVNIEHDKSTKISVEFSNIGRTPATDVHYVLVVQRIPEGSKPDFNYSEANADGVGVIIPGAKTGIDSEPILTEQELDQLNSGSLKLYLVGTAWYKDVFQRPRETVFCLVFEPKGKAFLFCPFHNSAN